MVSLVLKLFVSSRPLKLEGVLCIYVLLFREGQAENHLLCFSTWFEHTFDFHCFIIHDLSFVFLFMLYTWLLSFYCQDYVFYAHVLSSLIPALNALQSWSRLWWCMSPKKLFFCYHLPTRGWAGVKLGDAWYVSNVSIIFYAPCLFIHHLLYVCYTSWRFYAFSGTNLLTRCHSASSLFSAIFVFQKSYTANILGIGWNKSPTFYFYRSFTKTEDETDGCHGLATP
jgi:hypothetical protein